MGYYIEVVESDVKIKKEKFADALMLIKALHGQETIKDSSGAHFSWVQHNFYKRTELHDALCDWRWEPEYDDEGNICNLSFLGEKLGDDDKLLQAIAQCVEAGSYILVKGEDGHQWRWFFNGSVCKEEDSIVVFENDTEISVIEKDKFVKLLQQFLESAPEIVVDKSREEVAKAVEASNDHAYIVQLWSNYLTGH